MVDTLNLTRSQLGQFLQRDPNAIRVFELLFKKAQQFTIGYGVGSLLVGGPDGNVAGVDDVVAGNVLLSGGVGATPLFGKVGLTTHVTGTLGVPNGGTGATSLPLGGVLLGGGVGVITTFTTVANRSLWGAGAAGIDDDSGFIRTGDNGRYLFAASDNSTDKVQVSGGIAVDNLTLRTDTLSHKTTGVTLQITTLNSTVAGSPGGDVSITPGSGLTTGNGGGILLTSGGSPTGTTGPITLTVPAPSGASGSAGAGSLNGGDGVGGAGVGTSWLFTTGNGTGGNGVFTWRDNATTNSMTFAPATGVLTTPSITTAGGAAFHRTNTALTNSAAGNLGTLGNAPAAGNPTKWIGINDNGTIRQIPAW